MKKILLIIGLLGLLACSAATALAEMRAADNLVWYRFHFGMGVGSAAVSPDRFAIFLDTEITPRFPVGLTVTNSRGQWKTPKGGVIKERTVVVDIQCPDTDDNQKKADEVAQAYLKQFGKARSSVFILRIPGVSTKLWYE